MASSPHRVAVLALAPAVGYDVAIPPLIFGSATDGRGSPLYQVDVIGLGARSVPTTAGYGIQPSGSESLLATADTVVVPGTRCEGPRRHGRLDDELAAAWALIRPGTRIMSICTGAFVLAAAGVLDGRRVTTHWRHADDLARLYPRVHVEPGLLFVDDGDVLTSAGLAAGTDLCLHVVRRDHGPSVANRVARHCVVPPWREGGQAQFIEQAPSVARDETVSRVRTWCLEHLEEDLAVTTLAKLAGMSVRTFTRRFRTETGQAPGEWIIAQRVQRAQHLLETTDLPMETVAARAGLGGAVSLRAHMRARAGVSPTDYRRTFRGPSAEVDESESAPVGSPG